MTRPVATGVGAGAATHGGVRASSLPAHPSDPGLGCQNELPPCRLRGPGAGRSVSAAAVLAFVLTLAAATTPARAQTGLEPVEPPRMDHYEGSVRSQLAQAQSELDGLLNEPQPDRHRLAGAFGRLGQLYLLYDFMAPSAAALRNAQALAPDDPRWSYYLAINYRYEGALEESVAALDRVVAFVPNDLAALTHRADIRLELGLMEEAEADYRLVLERDPASSAARLGLGRIDFDRRDYQSAVERFEQALRGQPPGSVVHHHLGLALRRLGRREEAARQLELNDHLSVVFPDPLFIELQRLNVSREAHIKRGSAAMRQGNPRAALTAFLDALEAMPDDPLTIFNVGMALIELGEKEQAEARLRQSIAINDNYRDPQYNLALILAERGDLAGAERHFRRAGEIDPEDVEARVRHADILTRLQRTGEAVELLEGVLEADAASPLARLALGAAHQKAGAVDAAREALAKVLEAAPGAPAERAEAHYRLAVLAEANGDPIEHLRQAIELDPDFAEAHALLGRALARRELYVEGARHLARALRHDPANADWHRDRAMSLILGKRYAAARTGLTAGRQALARLENESGNDASGEDAIDHLDTLLARLLAASPDPSVRNGAEALAIARRLMSERPSIQHAETVAMALAEVGEFEQAATLQQQALDEMERRGGAPTAGQKERLRAYLNDEPAREPWFSP